MEKLAHTRKLGELLVELGLFQQEELAETIQLAMQIALPLGRALILSNRLSEDELRTVLQIQNLLKTGTLDLEQAKRALNTVRKDGIPLSVALERLGLSKGRDESAEQRSRLATLLLDAKLVSQEQVEEAQKLGYETGTAVGRMLAMSGHISFPILARALELQVHMREGKMTYSQAVEALTADSLRQLPADQAAEQRGHTQADTGKRVRLGELLMLAGLLTEQDMLNVIELGLTTPRPLGDICVEMGILTNDILNMALLLQTQVGDGSIDVRMAADTLQQMASTGLADLKPKPKLEESVRLGDLLQMSGLVDDTDIKVAIDLSAKYPAMIGKMLVVSGAIDEGTLLAALRGQFLVRNKVITIEESISALQYAQRHRLTLDEALEELGMATPEALR